jgi:SAM-dependent methyltransferase
MPVSPDDVRAAYRLILGRPPESEAAVALHQQHASIDALRIAFFSSEEFRCQALLASSHQTVSLFAPPQVIETTADPAALRAMVAKTAAAWEAVGETAPYHSVLTSDEYRPERFVENEISFFESGKQDLALIFALLHRIGRPSEGFYRCLEFGCGVGRVTAQLAATFSEVLALDISRPHLRLAQGCLARLGYTNVTFLQVTPENLHPDTGYDLWFSRLVLQHNPPPVTLEILNRMFAGLAPGGVAILHVPTYHLGYYFKTADYLTDRLPPENMHMHVTPQRPILELAWRHGCCLLDVREEPVPAEWLTNIFLFQKLDI